MSKPRQYFGDVVEADGVKEQLVFPQTDVFRQLYQLSAHILVTFAFHGFARYLLLHEVVVAQFAVGQVAVRCAYRVSLCVGVYVTPAPHLLVHQVAAVYHQLNV
ncbi:MAG: hypothetical protein LBQ59_04235 [Candidatus Peribacteria bacterium]|jgi:hypothetical protein|nr:hypothetical protein [Candidatus Peribacteria bacterium]